MNHSRAILTLAWREILRFLRQRNRVIGAVGQPVLFWLLFGAGLESTFRLGESGQSFRDYYFPGSFMLILLFTAIFTSISIIEDRKEGFLQSVLVSPVPRWGIVLGKVLGGTTLALLQGLLFLSFLFFTEMRPGLFEIGQLIFLAGIAAFGMTSLGFVLAWRLDSTQGFHAIMNLLLMPMWLLSGAFFPIPSLENGSFLLHWIMRCNPMSYAVSGVRQQMDGSFLTADLAADYWFPSLSLCWAVTILFSLLMFSWAWKTSSRRVQGDLR
ncbi:MAG: ABC transporter permease [Pirellulaceae bacterium]|nr:ABC transporter permease [Pirellulaceae bacterium]